jgi:hypothetical protein
MNSYVRPCGESRLMDLYREQHEDKPGLDVYLGGQLGDVQVISSGSLDTFGFACGSPSKCRSASSERPNFVATDAHDFPFQHLRMTNILAHELGHYLGACPHRRDGELRWSAGGIGRHAAAQPDDSGRWRPGGEVERRPGYSRSRRGLPVALPVGCREPGLLQSGAGSSFRGRVHERRPENEHPTIMFPSGSFVPPVIAFSHQFGGFEPCRSWIRTHRLSGACPTTAHGAWHGPPGASLDVPPALCHPSAKLMRVLAGLPLATRPPT